ncbi:muscle LIM protein Mlp84B isoform X1 [Folsomia candida]|uniref:muscle LIM protein Mlp84B isoform X1 n=1 Tax=Folsomia candida TaxID=158441 RepID=UPI000B905E11|nr:muscle LIM protein Mlp84B isoform X1 [Folsomia candida]
MPLKPPDNAKCPKCGRSVYAAEERLAGGHKWHKTCFKCGMCNKMLDSTNCAEHEGELFCKVCHARQFGPKGYGFGGGAGCLSMDTGEQSQEGSVSAANSWQAPNTSCIQAKEGEGCPRCGGAVYEAEKMLAKGRVFHKTCFKCRACSKFLDSTSHCDGPDRDIYCKVCYGKRFGPCGYGFGLGAGILQSDESLQNGDQYLSNKPNLISSTTTIMAEEGEGCPRCGGAVFEAEKVLAKGRLWHRKCFKCCECNKTLDSINACNGHDKEIYCKTCYGKKYGPKGYGFACGSGFLQTDVMPNEENDTQRPSYAASRDYSKIKPTNPGDGCPRCGGAVYEAEKMLAKGSVWHKTCFSCASCRRPLDSILSCDGPDREIYCKACYGKNFGPKGYGYGYSPTLISVTGESTAPLSQNIEGEKAPEGEGCGRCGMKVFEAEKMLAKGRVWHRRCFYCSDCRRSLDSTNTNDGPDGDIYCKGCYARRFGPKGVGYGIGAGALQMIQ